jgi:predicted nucleic acid-binding protein
MITVDTNVPVYRVDSREPVKRAKAQALLHQLAQVPTPPLLLWQALVEFVNQMQAWRCQQFLSDAHFDRVVHDVRSAFAIVYPVAGVMD